MEKGKVCMKSRLAVGCLAFVVMARGLMPGMKVSAQDLAARGFFEPGIAGIQPIELLLAIAAGSFLTNHAFVVAGEFTDFPEEAAGDLTRSGPDEVVLPFAVSKVYKSHVPFERMLIRVDADMLRYPGEEIARFSKRHEVQRQLTARMEEVDGELEELREARLFGHITAQEFELREAGLLTERDAIVTEYVNMPGRGGAVIHGHSFYDLGGAIKAGEPYLLGLKRSREDPSNFVLEWAAYSIYWGETLDEITRVLDAPDCRDRIVMMMVCETLDEIARVLDDWEAARQ